MLRLMRFFKNYRAQLILGPIFKLVEAVFELLVPLVMIKVIENGVKNSDSAYVLKMGGVIVAFGVIGLCCTLVCQYFASVASMGVGTALREALAEKISSFSALETERFGASKLLTRFTSDTYQLQLAAAMLIRLAIRAPFLVIGSVIMSFTIDPGMALIIVAVSPFVAFTIWLIMKKTVPEYGRMQASLDKVTSVTSENLTGVRVIRAFGREKTRREVFENASEVMCAEAERAGRLSALTAPVTAAIVNLGIVAVLWFGGANINTGTLSQGEIIALISYLSQISVAIAVTANIVSIFTKASASAKRINEVFDTVPSIKWIDDSRSAETGKNDSAKIGVQDDNFPRKIALRAENVSFSYGGGNVIEGISFELPKGSSLGVVGVTGSGKSTLACLLSRIYETGEGNIELFGRNIKETGRGELKKSISVCLQKASLISGSVRTNLLLSAPGADDDELIDALKTACAWEFVEKAGGLDATVEQNGRNFSGGQRQRLCIARTAASEAGILIFDDSFSALDVITERKVRGNITERCMSRSQTLIIISQRIASVRGCDRVMLLDEGKIAAFGTHKQLIKECPLYRDICASQEASVNE